MIPVTRNGRGHRGQKSETPQPGSEQQTAPEEAAEDLDARTEQALSRIHDKLSVVAGERQPTVAMRLVVKEMLADPEVADAMKARLPSFDDLAAALGKYAHYGRDHSAAVTAALAKARGMTRSGLEEKQDALWRHLEEILSALELSHLKTAFALSVVSRDRSSESTAAVAQNSIDIADTLESIRETTSRLVEGVEAPREATHVLAEAVEAKSLAEMREKMHALTEAAAELRETVAALARRVEEQRPLVRQILNDRRLVSAAGVDFLDEPRRPFSAHLADMLVLTSRLEPAEFDPSVPAAFEAAGNALARALLDARDESRELAPSLSG